MLRFLLDAGADINAPLEKAKYSPLGVAACFGGLSKTRFFLDAGADVNYLTPHGYSIPVHVIFARHDDERMADMLGLLVQYGAEINRASGWGESPLSVASRNGRFDVGRFWRACHIMPMGGSFMDRWMAKSKPTPCAAF